MKRTHEMAMVSYSTSFVFSFCSPLPQVTRSLVQFQLKTGENTEHVFRALPDQILWTPTSSLCFVSFLLG